MWLILLPIMCIIFVAFLYYVAIDIFGTKMNVKVNYARGIAQANIPQGSSDDVNITLEELRYDSVRNIKEMAIVYVPVIPSRYISQKQLALRYRQLGFVCFLVFIGAGLLSQTQAITKNPTIASLDAHALATLSPAVR